MKLRSAGLLVLLGALMIAPASAEVRAKLLEERVSFRSLAQTSPGEASGDIQLFLQFDGLTEAQVSTKDWITRISDAGSGTELVTVPEVKTLVEAPAGKATRLWPILLGVSKFPAAGATRARFLNITAGGVDYSLPYTVTSTATESFKWTVKAPAKITLEPGKPMPIGIQVGLVPAPKVKVLSSSLAEKRSGEPWGPKGIRVCRDGIVECKDTSIDLAARESGQFWLWGDSAAGEYSGTVSLVTEAQTTAEDLSIAVSVSSRELKITGVVLIFLGSVLAFWGISVVRGVINRTTLMRPFADLGAAVDDIEEYFNQDPSTVSPYAVSELAAARSSLASPKLEANGLPTIFSSPAPADIQKSAEKLTEYAKGIVEKIKQLRLLCDNGISELRKLGLTDKQLIEKVLAALDETYKKAIPDADKAAQYLLVPKATAAAAGSAIVNALDGNEPAASVPSLRSLSMTLKLANVAQWLTVTLATVATGTLILVIGDGHTGFGTTWDLTTCFLWGFGVPVGAQLSQQTPQSISTTLFTVR